tara:strand:+ start:6937 stop:7218 length:282 start_codon:yes stop_codon:yes gene_type:complete
MTIKADSLVYMSDDKIFNLFRKTERDLMKTRVKNRKGGSFKELTKKFIHEIELDLCYIFREIEHRNTRKKVHSVYLKERENHLYLTPSRVKLS